MTLAFLAVVLKVVVPPGFMVVAPVNEWRFPVVLCTDQGMVTVEPGQALPADGDRHDPPVKSAQDSPCAFAGHAHGAEPPTPFDVGPAQVVAYRALIPSSPPGVSPGRGLSGPPLPARGPPSLLI